MNGEPIHVSEVRKLTKAYTHVDTFNFQANPRIIENRWVIYKALFRNVYRMRSYGAASYSICYLAQGGFDLNVDLTEMQYEWDYFPPMIILREAGGVYETNGGLAFAGNKKLVTDIQKMLNKEGLLEN